MKDRIALTKELHKKGYNCAQAVACAYCDLLGMDEKTAFRATEAFGSGMGAMEGTCGAVVGAVFLAGLKGSTGNLDAPNSKAISYKLSKAITKEFQEKNGSLICKELKGMVPEHKIFRECSGCIEDAARLAEKILFESDEQ